MATTFKQVTDLIKGPAQRAKETIASRNLKGDAAERVRVKERLAGLEASVKELAKTIDRLHADQKKKSA